MKPLNAYASQVKNDVLGGLAATDDFPISLEQIKDTITEMRARLMQEIITSGKVLNPEGFYQLIPELPLHDTEDTRRKAGKIPALISLTGFSPIKYFGLPKFKKPYRVFTSHRYGMGRDIRTSNEPFIYLDTNFEFEVLKKDCGDKDTLSIEAIFSDPREIRSYGCVYDDETTRYPMPLWMADQVIGKLTNDYIRNYRSANPQPNSGTMIMNPVPATPNEKA